MLQVHDNKIISYEVNLEMKWIKFQTQSESGEQVQLVFSGVLAHQFENHLPGSIILDIEKRNIAHFYEENMALLEEKKNYSWPIHYSDRTELENTLVEEHYQYYVILASYGLNGWVLAKKMTV